MITLSTERGLVRIGSWNDICEIPGFTVDVNPRETRLESIIGRYTFSDFVRCGLVSCHKKHGKGYIVTITGGAVTNIGKDCGTTHFGVSFETMSRAYERDYRNAERRERLAAAQFQLPSYFERIDALRTASKGNWVYKTSHHFETSPEIPEPVREQLRLMIRTNDPRLLTSREASPVEIETLEVAQGRRIERPHYIDDVIATVAGLGVYARPDLRDLLVIDVLPGLKTLQSINIDSLSEQQLRVHVKWSDQIENKLHRAEQLIHDGHRFLVASNLQPFMDARLQLLRHANDRRAMLAFLRSLPP